MKIALICDMHMPKDENSIQWQFFLKSIEKIKKDGINTVTDCRKSPDNSGLFLHFVV